MTAETGEITQDSQADILSDRELLEDVQARLIRLDAHLTALLGAWTAGGLRGLRQAARGNFAARPGPDSSRAWFLADGLARLEAHDARTD